MRPIKYNIKLTIERQPLPIDLKENLIKDGLVKHGERQFIRNSNKIKELIEEWKKIVQNHDKVNIDSFKKEIDHKVNLSRTLEKKRELYESEWEKINNYLSEKKQIDTELDTYKKIERNNSHINPYFSKYKDIAIHDFLYGGFQIVYLDYFLYLNEKNELKSEENLLIRSSFLNIWIERIEKNRRKLRYLDKKIEELEEAEKEENQINNSINTTQKFLIIELLKEEKLFPSKNPYMQQQDYYDFIGKLIGVNPEDIKKNYNQEKVENILKSKLNPNQFNQQREKIIEVKKLFSRISAENPPIEKIIDRLDKILDQYI